MNEDRFEERLRRAAAEVRRPPETPRDEIWARIQAARQERRRRARDLRRWTRWGIGLAAMLVVGIGIGRLWEGRRDAGPTPPVASATAKPADRGITAAHRLATVQTLSRAEALLTSLRSTEPDPQVMGWAGDVLTMTRLLLDSRAGSDPQMRSLLEDLEVVLVQIVQLSGDGEELDWIRRGMEQRDVLPRIRSAIPGGATMMTMGT